MKVNTKTKMNNINPYQEMGRCPECNNMNQIFMGGYNFLTKYNAILKCTKCGNVHTKKITK